MRWRGSATWPRLTLLVAVVVAGTVPAVVVGVPSVTQLRDWVGSWGPAAPALFVLVYAVVTLAPVPKNVFSLAAGAAFGPWWGLLVVHVAAMLGAVVAFALARWLGRDGVARLTGGRVARVDDLVRRRGLVSVLALRLVPVLPFTAINYASGLTDVRLRDYVVGTAVGILPGTAVYVVLGAYLGEPGSWPFLASLGALLVLVGVGGVLGWRRRRVGARHVAGRVQAQRSSDAGGGKRGR